VEAGDGAADPNTLTAEFAQLVGEPTRVVACLPEPGAATPAADATELDLPCAGGDAFQLGTEITDGIRGVPRFVGDLAEAARGTGAGPVGRGGHLVEGGVEVGLVQPALEVFA
jgi:hypothetical protein